MDSPNSPSHPHFYLPEIERLSYFKPLQNTSETTNLDIKKVGRSLSSELKVTFFGANSEIASPTHAKQRLLDQIKSSEVNLKCKEHPDEEFQYYSFTNNKGLCSECLLSGRYTGCEVLGLKKAADKIRPRFDSMMLDVAEKAGSLGLLLEKLVERKIKLNDFGNEFKDEVKEQFDALRAAIDEKEKEILENIEKVKKEEQDAVEAKYEATKRGYQEVLNIRDTLSTKLEGFKDLDLCQYYASKATLIETFVEGESSSAHKELKTIAQKESASEEYNLTAFDKEMDIITEKVNGLKGLEKGVKRILESERVEALQSVQSREQEVTTPKLNQVISIQEIKPFQNLAPKVEPLQEMIKKIEAPKEEEVLKEYDSLLDADISLTITRKPLSFKEIRKEREPVRAKSSIPFEYLKQDLEPISPLSRMTTEGENSMSLSPTEEKLKKLFEKVESIGRSSPKKESLKEQKPEFRGHSSGFISYLDGGQKPKDSAKKSWDWTSHTEPAEDKGLKKSETTYSTIKLIDLDNTKSIPRLSFIPSFTPTKNTSNGPETFNSRSSKKDLLSTPWTTGGLSSTKNLKTVPHEESIKQHTNATWNSLLKSRTKTEEAPSVSRSFGTSALSSNLRQLKKQMGLLGDFS